MKIETNKKADGKSNGKLLPGIFLRFSVVDFPISLLAAVVEFSFWPWNYESPFSFTIFCYFSTSHTPWVFFVLWCLGILTPVSLLFVGLYFRSFCFGLIKSKVFAGFSRLGREFYFNLGCTTPKEKQPAFFALGFYFDLKAVA